MKTFKALPRSENEYGPEHRFRTPDPTSSAA